ncbi:Ribose import permease protein RbsC [subsurface metagenome]
MAEIVEKPKRFSAREVARRVFRHENAILVVILIAIVAGISSRTKGLTTSRGNIMNVTLQSSMRGLASIGQAFVILTGGIDISIGGLALASACLGAGLMTSEYYNIIGTPLPISIGIGIMLLVGLGVGAFNGLLISRIGMPALIVTLAMWQILTGIGYQVTGGTTFLYLPQSLAFFGQGYIAGVPVPVIIFVAAAVAAYFVLYHTTFGRSVYAVGGNPVSTWLSGVNVKRVQLTVYVISGFLAALAGVIALSRAMAASLYTAAGLELDSIASVVIGGVSLAGGRGTLIGPIIGVFIIGVINNGLNAMGVPPQSQDILKGVIILVAVMIDHLRRR